MGIDPGLKGVACAVLDARGVVQDAFFSRARGPKRDPQTWNSFCHLAFDRCLQTAGQPLLVVIENPIVYTRGGAPAEDLMPIANVVGILLCQFMQLKHAAVKTVYPAEWKGQVPKTVHQGRIAKTLTEEEIQRLDTTFKGEMVDILDAIGIAKKFAPGPSRQHHT